MQEEGEEERPIPAEQEELEEQEEADRVARTLQHLPLLEPQIGEVEVAEERMEEHLDRPMQTVPQVEQESSFSRIHCRSFQIHLFPPESCQVTHV
jgi:hypothetical protein